MTADKKPNNSLRVFHNVARCSEKRDKTMNMATLFRPKTQASDFETHAKAGMLYDPTSESHYGLTCKFCNACSTVRLSTDPTLNRTQRKQLNRGDRLLKTDGPRKTPVLVQDPETLFAWYDVYNAFWDDRLKERVLEDDRLGLQSFANETSKFQGVCEFHDQDGELAAFALLTRIGNTVDLSAIYYREQQNLSVGTYVILKMQEMAKRSGVKHIYIGQWAKDSKILGYKARRDIPQRPMEALRPRYTIRAARSSKHYRSANCRRPGNYTAHHASSIN